MTTPSIDDSERSLLHAIREIGFAIHCLGGLRSPPSHEESLDLRDGYSIALSRAREALHLADDLPIPTTPNTTPQ